MDNYFLELANQPAKRAELRARMLEVEQKTAPIKMEPKEIRRISRKTLRAKYRHALCAEVFAAIVGTGFLVGTAWFVCLLL